MDPSKTTSAILFGVLLCLVVCGSIEINGGDELTKVQETLLQEYRLEVARKLSDVKSSRDFLRIFVPSEEIEPTFVAIVNETVQMKNKGRFFGPGTSFNFDLDISNKAMAEWERHGASVTCAEPTRILLDMSDELDLPRGTGSYIFPACTWVRRCAGSGCCPSERQECAGVLERRVNVTKPFVKITLTDIDESGHVTPRPQFLNYTLFEDTACECRTRPDAAALCEEIPCPEKQEFSVAKCDCKCRRRCPEPFDQEPDTCNCVCAPGNRQCLKVMRGKNELNQAQCSCVGHGCEPPKCRRHWTFSKATCKCSERAPPPSRARVLNEVFSGPGSSRAGSNVELLSEPASGMVAVASSLSNATTTKVSYSQTPTVAADMDENSSSSSSSADEGMVVVQQRNPHLSLVHVPVRVPLSKRYGDGGGQHRDFDFTRHDVEVEAGTAIRPKTTKVNDSSSEDDRRTPVEPDRQNTHSHIVEKNTTSMTTKTINKVSTTASPTVETSSPNPRRHQIGLGFEDDEDEMTLSRGEDGDFGSGSTPEED